MFGFKRAPKGVALVEKTLLERMEDLEDNQARLDRRFERLQGEFGASMRRQRQLERENDDLRDELDANDVSEDGE